MGYVGLVHDCLGDPALAGATRAQFPWGRMMRAIRDNEIAAEAMGKDVTARHLQIFILGSAICGIAGAMMTTLDGQLTPTHLSAAALYLPDLGDGDCGWLGQ